MYAVIATAFISCTSMYRIKRGDRLTNKMMNSLSEKNGNAFCFTSQYVNGSVVWTYYNGKIKVYDIKRGRIDSSREYSSSCPHINQMSGNEGIEILPCIGMNGAYKYVGSYKIACLTYRMKRGDEVVTNTFPLVVDSFTEHKFESEFLNKIAEDINKYDIWYGF